MVSISEMNMHFKDLIMLNYPGKIHHFYSSIEDQGTMSKVCLLCEGSLRSRVFGQCQPARSLPEANFSNLNLFISGSPCTPFSLQRSKRFAAGNVKNHVSFGTNLSGRLHNLLQPSSTLQKVLLKAAHGSMSIFMRLAGHCST